MSYAKAMKWGKRHPKGTRQPILMHTNSGFWPSGGYLKEDFWPYQEACKAEGVEPVECKTHYDAQCRGGAICGASLDQQVEWTRQILWIT